MRFLLPNILTNNAATTNLLIRLAISDAMKQMTQFFISQPIGIDLECMIITHRLLYDNHDEYNTIIISIFNKRSVGFSMSRWHIRTSLPIEKKTPCNNSLALQMTLETCNISQVQKDQSKLHGVQERKEGGVCEQHNPNQL